MRYINIRVAFVVHNSYVFHIRPARCWGVVMYFYKNVQDSSFSGILCLCTKGRVAEASGAIERHCCNCPVSRRTSGENSERAPRLLLSFLKFWTEWGKHRMEVRPRRVLGIVSYIFFYGSRYTLRVISTRLEQRYLSSYGLFYDTVHWMLILSVFLIVQWKCMIAFILSSQYLYWIKFVMNFTARQNL